MFNRRATAALALTIAATGCGNNPAVPFVGPPATSSPTPTATPVGATPTVLDIQQHTVAVAVTVTCSGLVVQKKGVRP